MLDQKLGPPYAPPANIRSILTAWRDRGAPARIDRDWFERIGLSANLSTRNLHALRYLRLVDANCRPTDLVERLRIAATDTFPRTLAAIVRTAYADVWASCDPAVEPRARIEDAFRHATPAAQRSRMVACFIGLCEAAEIRPTNRDRAIPRSKSARVRAIGTSRVPAVREDIAPGTTSAATEAARPTPVALEFLLAKFPDFDPAWPDGIKERWFDAFARLRDEIRR